MPCSRWLCDKWMRRWFLKIICRESEINPRILQIVRQLATSQPIPLPILCSGNGKVPDVKVMKLKKIFLEANGSDDSADLMEMLQFDAWDNYAL